MGIGVDIIEIDRIDRLLRHYPRFRAKVFSAREIAYCEQKRNPSQHYAARFAAKESIIKILRTGDVGPLRWRDLEILREPSGRPFVRLNGSARLVGDRMGIEEITVSLSHCNSYAIAVAHVVR
ncbi:MAG: holo-ACP synthase [Deltaproteobacteria bacterium]|nr:holo-ACP synthase [Deltaproteobacteria bacterium]